MIPSDPTTQRAPLQRRACAQLPTRFGPTVVYGYTSSTSPAEHLAVVVGDLMQAVPLVRVHSECLTGDVIGSLRCDCGEQRDRALEAIAEAGTGVFLYLRQEGRGIGLINKLLAYDLQDQGYDTVEANLELGFPADLRDFSLAADILADLGVERLRLLTNNPRKVATLESLGLAIIERVPLLVEPNAHNSRYLSTKAAKLGHLLS